MSSPRRAGMAVGLACLAAIVLSVGCSRTNAVPPVPTPCAWDVIGTWYTTADGGFFATQPDFEISFDVPAADGSLTGTFASPGGFPSSPAAGSYDGKTIELHTRKGPPIGITVTMGPDGKTASGKTTDNANLTLTLFSRAPQCR